MSECRFRRSTQRCYEDNEHIGGPDPRCERNEGGKCIKKRIPTRFLLPFKKAIRNPTRNQLQRLAEGFDIKTKDMNERTIMKRIYDFGKIARKTPDGHNDLIEFCESQNNKEQTYCYNMIRTYGYRNEMTRQPAPMNTAEYLDSLKDLKKNKNNEKFKEMISYKFCECVGGRLMVKRIRMDFGVVLRQPSPYESCKNTIYYRRRIKVPEDVSYMCSAQCFTECSVTVNTQIKLQLFLQYNY